MRKDQENALPIKWWRHFKNVSQSWKEVNFPNSGGKKNIQEGAPGGLWW